MIVFTGRITRKFQYALLCLKMCSISVEQTVLDLIPVRTDKNLNEIWGPDGRKDWRRNTWNGCAVFWRVSADLHGSAKTLHTHTHKPYLPPQKTPNPSNPRNLQKPPKPQKPYQNLKESLTFNHQFISMNLQGSAKSMDLSSIKSLCFFSLSGDFWSAIGKKNLLLLVFPSKLSLINKTRMFS